MDVKRKIRITYVTSSEYKENENKILSANGVLPDGAMVADVFEFQIRRLPIRETLEVDIELMVRAEVAHAYSILKIPCVVEHAGLVFDEYKFKGYPGGLTKPMWNALGDDFVSGTHSAGKRAIAVACVAYCDGKKIQVFRGETAGKIAEQPYGSSHQFYWDTVFIPDDPEVPDSTRTYAEIVDEPTMGLKYKVLKLSQSCKAMMRFLEYRRNNQSDLWPDL